MKNILGCRRGVTLVELVVTFAILVLFTVCSTQLMSSAIKVYHQMKSVNYSRQVMGTLMDKIAGELEGAQESITLNGSTSSATLEIIGKKRVALRDRTQSPVEIYNDEDGRLCVKYLAVTGKDETGSELIRYEPVEWKYDDPVYMGFKIEKLTFEIADTTEYPKNVLKVGMTIKSDKYGSYSTTRYVECYNFEKSPEKIEEVP